MKEHATEGAGPIRQHQRLAREGGDPQEHTDFGVLPHNHSHKPHSEPHHGKKKHMHDKHRAIPQHDGGYHAHPDHGPFHKDHRDHHRR
jgi:hypothetical protein